MSCHYNLRSLKKKKSTNDLLSPVVKIKRLEILDNLKDWNSRFYVEGDKILLKKVSNVKVRYLIVFFGVFFIIAASIFFKDDIADAVVTGRKLSHSLQLGVRKFRGWIFNRFLKKKKEYNETQTKNCLYKNSIVDYLKDHEKSKCNSKINKSIETEIIGLLNGINSKETSGSFIKEECKKELHPAIFNNFNDFDDLVESSVLIDYALQSRGAQVLSVYDTKPYGDMTLKYFDFVMNNFLFHCLFNSNGPTSVLVPWTKPGDCWAFKGSEGRILLKLSKKIVITAISIDHISKDLLRGESIESAPKTFSVVGIEELDVSKKITFLGTFEYRISGPNLQTFYLNSSSRIYHNLVEFSFYSNQGNEHYTCIYKIRVHGYA